MFQSKCYGVHTTRLVLKCTISQQETGWWWWCTHLLGEDGDVLVEGLGGADVTARHPRLPRCAGRQLALLEDKGE